MVPTTTLGERMGTCEIPRNGKLLQPFFIDGSHTTKMQVLIASATCSDSVTTRQSCGCHLLLLRRCLSILIRMSRLLD